MPFSFRLDPETEALIRRLARARGRSKSAIVREAVEHYGSRHTAADGTARTALDIVRPFAGIVSTGGHYSSDTHAKYRAVLKRKVSARRSG